jgi:hypothetical protein
MEKLEANGLTFFIFEVFGQTQLDLRAVNHFNLPDDLQGAQTDYFWALGGPSPFPFLKDAQRKNVLIIQVAYATIGLGPNERANFRRLLKQIVPNENSVRPASDAIPRGEAKSVSRSRPCLSLANEIRRSTRVQVSTVRTLISFQNPEGRQLAVDAYSKFRRPSIASPAPARNPTCPSRTKSETLPSFARRTIFRPRTLAM